MLGIINLNVNYKRKEIIYRLYNGIIRPLIEHCAQVWAFNLRKDIHMLWAVQHRGTRMILDMKIGVTRIR